MKLTLTHFTENPFTFDPKRQYKNKSWTDSFKPSGLWLSHEESGYGWSHWCREAEWGTNSLQNQTNFICDTSSWLVMKESDQLTDFTKKYGRSMRRLMDVVEPNPQYIFHHMIDWDLVQCEFAGILISPYIWESRLFLMWYSGWDCASACVWDLSTVKRVRPKSSR